MLKLANVTTHPCLMWPHYILYVIKLRTNYYGPYAYCSLDKGVAYTGGGGGSHCGHLGHRGKWVQNSLLFAQRGHSVRTAHGAPPGN